jgi:hypothetical protein
MDLLLSLKTLLLEYETADDLQLWPHDEDDLFLRWLYRLPVLKLNDLRHVPWLITDDVGHLLNESLIEEH